MFFVVSIFGPFKDRIVVIVGIAAGVVAAILFSVGPIRAFVIKRRVKGLTEAPDTSDKPMEG